MKLIKPDTTGEQQEARILLTKKIEDSLIEKSFVFIAKHKDELIGVVAVEINDSVALLHAISVNEPFQSRKYSQKLMSALTMKIAYMGVRSLYVLTQSEDVFFFNSHFALVEDKELPDNYRSYYQSKINECQPRIFYKHLPNPWPYNPFR